MIHDRDGEMVQVFDPTDGNMTPCTESLRYANYAIKNCGSEMVGSCLLKLFHCFRVINSHTIYYHSGSAYNGCDDEASPLSQVSHPNCDLCW